jgi:hypothetical protein
MWAMYIVTVVVLLAAMEAGYRLTKGTQRKKPAKGDAGVGSLAGATLALLAFLLAFVVSFAVGIFNERRALVVMEANAIGTAYLRAGYLDEPYRSESQDLLREYVDQRIAALDRENLVSAKARSEEIHNELWGRAETVAREAPTPITGLYVSAVNDVIDVHTERVSTSLGIRVPPAILLSIYLVGILTMFLVGMQSGYSESRNLTAIIMLVLILSVVFMLIVDLDRSGEGLMKVSQQALFELQKQLTP